MNRVVVYGSQYGSAEKYAREFAQRINVPVYEYKKVKNVKEYDEIIYFGGIYNGNIYGLGHFVKKQINDIPNLRIVTVGLGDPNDQKNKDNILKSVKRYMGDDFVNKTKFYHVRGAFDQSKLNMVNKTMMKTYYETGLILDEKNRTEITAIMADAYNKKLDYMDFGQLDSIVADL